MLRDKIKAFNIYMPLITSLTSEAIKPDDWKELAASVNEGIDPPEELTLQKMIDWQLLDHMEQIEEITTKAEKKYNLEKQLEAMKMEWKDRILLVVDYKTTFVIKGYDDIQNNVDDQISNTQAMLGNQFCAGNLKRAAKEWEQKLFLLSDILEEIQKCQRTWLYLEPIFNSDDIIKKMAKEHKLFKDVDELWRDTMENTNREPAVLDLVEREGIKESFEKSNHKLDEIQKVSKYILNIFNYIYLFSI